MGMLAVAEEGMSEWVAAKEDRPPQYIEAPFSALCSHRGREPISLARRPADQS